jgi:NitT/TauT family transport system substrate-binding protein
MIFPKAFQHRWQPIAAAALIGIMLGSASAGAADKIKLGVIKTTSSGPIYIAIEKGYFAAAGIEAELVFFDAAQPIAVATVSGDVDVGSTGLTAGFYAFAAQGAVRIIGGQGREAPGFHNLGYMVSNHAYDGGLKSLKDMAGHSVAVSQTGAPGHYVIGALAEKYGVDLASIKVLSLQSVPNIFTALIGGQTDGGVTIVTVPIMPAIDRGELRVLAWVGDELDFQDRAIFVSAKTDSERSDMLGGGSSAPIARASTITAPPSSAPAKCRRTARPPRRLWALSANMSASRRQRSNWALPMSIR